MAFTKQEVEYFPFGASPIENGMWSNLNLNQDELYENVIQPVLFCITDFTIPAADTGFHTHFKWMLEKNVDNEDVLVFIRAKRTGGSGTVVFKAHLDATDDDASSIASGVGTAYQDIILTVTPTTSTTSREMYLEIKTSDTGTAAHVDSIAVYTVPGSPSVGTLTSSFVGMPSAGFPTDGPINTERMSRLRNGPIHVTHDRPSCVYSFLDDFANPRNFKTNSTAFVSTLNARIPFPDKVRRDYLLYMYLNSNSGSGSPSARIILDGKQIGSDVSGAGWKTFYLNEITNDIKKFHHGYLDVHLKDASGSYYTSVTSLQIIRIPVAP